MGGTMERSFEDLFLLPNENARAARDENEGGGGSSSSSGTRAGAGEGRIGVCDFVRPANRLSSDSRSCSSDEGNVDDELCRPDVAEETS